MSVFEQFLRFIAPHSCLGCGAEGRLLCSDCAALLPTVPSRCYRCLLLTKNYAVCQDCLPKSALDAALPATTYDGLAKQLVHRLKFERAKAAAADIATACAGRFPSLEATVITYVPTAPARIRTRGYDQAALIAKALARRSGLPCRPLLGRIHAARQVGSDRKTRQQQIQDAFYLRQTLPAGSHVLLVDDVLTTGATCEAAASLLKSNGISRVTALVFAVAEAKQKARADGLSE
ncbi:MAG TPA: phosphoribosyltransferase family protein [Candidatus Saccharimonadales bacterium]